MRHPSEQQDQKNNGLESINFLAKLSENELEKLMENKDFRENITKLTSRTNAITEKNRPWNWNDRGMALGFVIAAVSIGYSFTQEKPPAMPLTPGSLEPDSHFAWALSVFHTLASNINWGFNLGASIAVVSKVTEGITKGKIVSNLRKLSSKELGHLLGGLGGLGLGLYTNIQTPRVVNLAPSVPQRAVEFSEQFPLKTFNLLAMTGLMSNSGSYVGQFWRRTVDGVTQLSRKLNCSKKEEVSENKQGEQAREYDEAKEEDFNIEAQAKNRLGRDKSAPNLSLTVNSESPLESLGMMQP